MIDSRTKILIGSVRKLLRRGAYRNIQRMIIKTHTADVALILEELDPTERLEVLKLEQSKERRAEILSYLDRRIQQEIVPNLDRQEVKTLVGLMESDDAVELLRNLEEDFSQDILNSMVREDQEDVTNLLRYPEDSAGGHMSSEYLSLIQTLTVGDAIREIQEKHGSSSINFYIYVVDELGRLVGVLSLKQLLLHRPGIVLKDIMNTDLIFVRADAPQQEVARMVERYDFLAVPVVDEGLCLVGVITVDDVIDVIREEAQEDLLAIGQVGVASNSDDSVAAQLRSRFPSLSLIFLGGFLCFITIDSLVVQGPRDIVGTVSAFVPLILSLTTTGASQAATWAIGLVRTGRIDRKTISEHFWHELKVVAIIGLAFSLILCLIGWLATSSIELSGLVASILFLQIVMSSIIGNLIPLFLQKVHLDPAVATISILTAVTNVSSVGLLYGLVQWFLGTRGIL